MLGKIVIIENDNFFIDGSHKIETYDKKFVKELKKFICPARIGVFLQEQINKGYTPYTGELKDEECSFIINLNSQTQELVSKQVENKNFFNGLTDNYIKSTPYLDKYGND